jgi:hypothetical protein
MRPRLAVLAAVVTTLVAVVVPSAVTATPRHNRGLTINVTPNPILAGEGVFIYGQLNDSPLAGQTIILYHHLAGSGRGYTRVSATKTDARGFYEFTRAENVVETNRSWFVREAGVHGVHSRTVFERVAALVSLTASTTTADTGQPVVFTGHVDPNHAGEEVLLQQQVGSSDDWHTLKSGRLGPGSDYAITYRFRFAGERDVRVLFPADVRNIRGASDPVTMTIEQTQIPGFTINSSAPLIDYGQPVTISGVLDQSSAANKAEPGTPVTLWARDAFRDQFIPVADTTTGQDGSYKFNSQFPSSNTVYLVRTTLAPHRHSAALFEGVKDVVTMTPSSTTSTVGGRITLDGTVLPDKTGHVIYLQRLGPDGEWHNVEIRVVQFGSTFHFAWTFGKAGTYVFRARITSDHANVGGASAPVTIQVSPAPNPAALPPAS